MKKTGSDKKRVLGDYKKIGSTFVPPMVHRVGPLSYVSWARQIMPELIWWDVISGQTSPRFAAKIAGEIAKHFKSRGKHQCWWAFISDYSLLSLDEIDALKEHLQHLDLLNPIGGSLWDFLNLYPECPLSRLMDSCPNGAVDLNYLSSFENRMKDLEDKHSRNAVLIQAQAIYMGFSLGKLKVAKGLALADFPEVEHYPNTERSKQVGSAICASVNMLAGTKLPTYPEDAWALYFWRRSLELRRLDFSHLEKR